jgi:hypothetical protein
VTRHLTDHFTDTELECRDGCGYGRQAADYAPGFLDYLEVLRTIYGRPIYPTSGARCTDHNRAVGGRPQSAHTRAGALDISADNGYDRHGLAVAHILAVAVTLGRLELADAVTLAEELAHHGGGLGIAKTFVHVDTDHQLPRPSSWGYPPNTNHG